MTQLEKFAKDNNLTEAMYKVVDGREINCFEYDGRLKCDIPKGIYKYQIRESDSGCIPSTIEPRVLVNHFSDICTDVDLKLGKDDYLEIDSKWWYEDVFTVGQKVWVEYPDDDIFGDYIISQIGTEEKPYIDSPDDFVTIATEKGKIVGKVPVYSLG